MAPKILIIEDDSFSAQVLETALKRRSYEVLTAFNGMQGLKAVQEQHPDLVLLDLMLPGIDGYEVLNRIRSNPQTANTPVIVVSAKTSEDDQQMAQRIGANGYITKPYQLTQLYQVIQQILEQSSTPSVGSGPGQLLVLLSLPRAESAPVVAALAQALRQRLPASEALLVADLRPYTTSYEQVFHLAQRLEALKLSETSHIQQWSTLASQPEPGLYVLYNLKGDAPLGGFSVQNMQMLCDTVLNTVRFVLLEIPLQTSELVLKATQRARQVCFISSPDPADIMNAHALLQALSQQGINLNRCAILVRGTPLKELLEMLPIEARYVMEDPITPATPAIATLVQTLLA